MSADAFRPRTTSELLDASVQLIRANYASLLMLSVIGLLPYLASIIYHRVVLVPQYADRAALYAFPLLIIAMGWAVVVDVAIVRAASDAYLGNVVEPRTALRHAIRRAGTIILATILKYVLIFVGTLLVMMAATLAAGMLLGVVWGGMATAGHGLGGGDSPAFKVAMGVILGSVFGLAVIWWILFSAARLFGYRAAIILEGCDSDASLRRSNALAREHVLKIIGAFVLAYVIYFAVYLLLFAFGSLASDQAVVAEVAAGIGGMFIYPIIPVVTTLLYYDMRMRKEGYDIELMAGELGRREAGSGTGDAVLPSGEGLSTMDQSLPSSRIPHP